MPQPRTATVGSRGLERAAMGLGVDAAGETADDDETRSGEVAAEAAGDLPAVGRAGTRADDRDRGSGEQLGVCRTAEKEARRRIVDRAEQRRERRVGAGRGSEARVRASRASSARPSKRGFERREARASRLSDEVRVARRGEGGERELVHAASSLGERYASASATCSGSTVSAPASAAAVRATRATRARPRPESGRRSTARLEELVGLRGPPAAGRRPDGHDRSRPARGRAPTALTARPPAPPPAVAGR